MLVTSIVSFVDCCVIFPLLEIIRMSESAGWGLIWIYMSSFKLPWQFQKAFLFVEFWLLQCIRIISRALSGRCIVPHLSWISVWLCLNHVRRKGTCICEKSVFDWF